jgi:hypothetical protein
MAGITADCGEVGYDELQMNTSMTFKGQQGKKSSKQVMYITDHKGEFEEFEKYGRSMVEVLTPTVTDIGELICQNFVPE